MFVKKIGDQYYLCRSKKKSITHPRRVKKIYNSYLIKDGGSDKYSSGCLYSTRKITFPKELIGKKVRLIVEIL